MATFLALINAVTAGLLAYAAAVKLKCRMWRYKEINEIDDETQRLAITATAADIDRMCFLAERRRRLVGKPKRPLRSVEGDVEGGGDLSVR